MRFDDILKEMKEEDRIKRLLESKGLSISLTKNIIHPYSYFLEPIHVAQAHGIHLKTVKRYYEILGSFVESEFNNIFKFCMKRVCQTIGR